MKELFDQRVIFGDLIRSAFRKVAENKEENLKIHFVYAGTYYQHRQNQLKDFILKGMKIHGIKSVMITFIDMHREKLITKEEMEITCAGKANLQIPVKDSVNDDLESMFEDIRLGKQPVSFAETYFLPKLTKEELKLVGIKDPMYLKTFLWTNKFSEDPDVNQIEIKLSESNSKFVSAFCPRRTFILENLSIPK